MAAALVVPLLLAALIANALAAGFFYAFVCAVMPGLRRTDDATFVSSMVAINAAVQNPLFAVSFFGGFLASAGAFTTAALTGQADPALWSGVAVALFVAQYAVTFSRNIPLNVELDRRASGHRGAARAGFESPWVVWNVLRTAVTTAAVLCLGIALVVVA